jgi:hypothetical protein
MEKHKVKVQELVSEYQRFEGDTGCTEVQGKLAFLSSYLNFILQGQDQLVSCMRFLATGASPERATQSVVRCIRTSGKVGWIERKGLGAFELGRFCPGACDPCPVAGCRSAVVLRN